MTNTTRERDDRGGIKRAKLFRLFNLPTNRETYEGYALVSERDAVVTASFLAGTEPPPMAEPTPAPPPTRRAPPGLRPQEPSLNRTCQRCGGGPCAWVANGSRWVLASPAGEGEKGWPVVRVDDGEFHGWVVVRPDEVQDDDIVSGQKWVRHTCPEPRHAPESR